MTSTTQKVELYIDETYEIQKLLTQVIKLKNFRYFFVRVYLLQYYHTAQDSSVFN